MAMRAIMADNDIAGQLETIVTIWQSEEWREIWSSLSLEIQTFKDLGLPRTIPDIDLWKECQRLEIVLFTANRNRKGEESLEAAIANLNTPQSLPVFTLANAGRCQHDNKYATRVAVNFLQYLLEIDTVRGAGRLYLP
jgi:hypothetical protein